MAHLPYHYASSSSAGATAAGIDLGAAFFLEKRATVLNVAGFDVVGGADLVAPRKLRGFRSISDTPREAAALDAAREAIVYVSKLSVIEVLRCCCCGFDKVSMECGLWTR